MSVVTFLWFDHEAEEAADLYAALVPNSRITDLVRGPDGAAFVVTVELDGHTVVLMNGGPGHTHSEAASLQVSVDTQEEIDRLWDGLTAEGGIPGECGWLVDRWGLSWQVIPAELPKLMSGDPARAGAVMTALRGMGRIDLAELRAARDRA